LPERGGPLPMLGRFRWSAALSGPDQSGTRRSGVPSPPLGRRIRRNPLRRRIGSILPDRVPGGKAKPGLGALCSMPRPVRSPSRPGRQGWGSPSAYSGSTRSEQLWAVGDSLGRLWPCVWSEPWSLELPSPALSGRSSAGTSCTPHRPAIGSQGWS